MTNSIEDLRDIYRVFDQQMSAALRVSGATSADDVVDTLLTTVLRFASVLILRHPNRREMFQVLPERLRRHRPCGAKRGIRIIERTARRARAGGNAAGAGAVVVSGGSGDETRKIKFLS